MCRCACHHFKVHLQRHHHHAYHTTHTTPRPPIPAYHHHTHAPRLPPLSWLEREAVNLKVAGLSPAGSVPAGLDEDMASGAAPAHTTYNRAVPVCCCEHTSVPAPHTGTVCVLPLRLTHPCLRTSPQPTLCCNRASLPGPPAREWLCDHTWPFRTPSNTKPRPTVHAG